MPLFDKEAFKKSFNPMYMLKILLRCTLFGVAGMITYYSKYDVYPGLTLIFITLTIQATLFCIVVGAMIDQVVTYRQRKKAA